MSSRSRDIILTMVGFLPFPIGACGQGGLQAAALPEVCYQFARPGR